MPWALMLLATPVLFTLCRRQVDWRGRPYRLGGRGQLHGRAATAGRES
jgi:hypothetical protein